MDELMKDWWQVVRMDEECEEPEPIETIAAFESLKDARWFIRNFKKYGNNIAILMHEKDGEA